MKKDDLIRTLDELGDRLTAATSRVEDELRATEGAHVTAVAELDPLVDAVRRLALDLRTEDVSP